MSFTTSSIGEVEATSPALRIACELAEAFAEARRLAGLAGPFEATYPAGNSIREGEAVVIRDGVAYGIGDRR